MAESYRFFGSATGDTRQYSQVDFAEVMGTIIGNGYLGQVGNELLVIQNTPDNMTVLVKSGQAWINGYWYKNDSDKSITVSTADASYPRIDLVVLRLDTLNARSIVATIKTGTPASVPVVPSLTQTSQMWEIPLAQVYVAAGSTSIVVGNITDLRTQALLQDTDEILAQVALKAPLESPAFTGTVSGITKAMVGLGNVTNESKATMFTSPTFTGTVSGITASMVGLGNVTNESKATMFTSPTFTGTVSGVTASMVGLGNVTNESKATMFTSPNFTGNATVASQRIITNDTTAGTAVYELWSGTQAQYNAIGTKDANTLYFIVG